jgi:hypothetical protein
MTNWYHRAIMRQALRRHRPLTRYLDKPERNKNYPRLATATRRRALIGMFS